MQQLKKTDVSEKRPYPKRHALPHDPPPSVDTTDAVFFITICCKRRRENQLCTDEVARVLFDAVKFYQARGDWFVHLVLLMPDHAHFLAMFERNPMRQIVDAWKRFTARKAGFEWQRDFFDHRLRRDESFREKSDYILANPVRAGLVADGSVWPFMLIADPVDGRFGETSLPQ